MQQNLGRSKTELSGHRDTELLRNEKKEPRFNADRDKALQYQDMSSYLGEPAICWQNIPQ
jgi:hypothetical protein